MVAAVSVVSVPLFVFYCFTRWGVWIALFEYSIVCVCVPQMLLLVFLGRQFYCCKKLLIYVLFSSFYVRSFVRNRFKCIDDRLKSWTWSLVHVFWAGLSASFGALNHHFQHAVNGVSKLCHRKPIRSVKSVAVGSDPVMCLCVSILCTCCSQSIVAWFHFH